MLPNRRSSSVGALSIGDEGVLPVFINCANSRGAAIQNLHTSDFMQRFLFMAAGLLLAVGLSAQATISGTVTDREGQPLLGANLYLLETQQGTTTNDQGFFVLDSPSGNGDYTLRVSYVGYQTQERKLPITAATEDLMLQIKLAAAAAQITTLTVRATRADAQTPMTYTNVDEDDLAPLNLGQDLPFLLRWTPSVVATSDAGAGIGYTGIRIRGTDPTRINVTVNGIPINDAESQGVFWVNMPDFTSSAADIQVQRGVGTSTNGAGAFGATVNINTAQVRPDAYASVSGSLGSFNTQRANVLFGSGLLNNRFTMEGRLSRITSDGYIDRATSDLSSYYLSGAYVGKRSTLRLNVFSGRERTYQAWYGVPREFLDDRELRTFNPSGTEREGEPYENEVDNYRQTHYQLLYDQQLSDRWSANLSLHYTQGQGYFEQYKAGQLLEDYGIAAPSFGDTTITATDLIRRLWLDNDFYGGIYALNYDNDRLDFTLGGGYNRYEGLHFGEVIWAEYAGDSELGDRYYENDAIKTDFNIYARANFGLVGELNAYIDLQYRRVGYDFLGIDRSLNPVRDEVQLNFFNPKAGLFYEINARSNAYASFAVAQREPNRNDYVESTADSRPKPEQLYNTEIGYRVSGGKAALEANVYYMYYRDQLVLNGEVNDVGAYTRVNVDESYRLGLELAGGVQVLPSIRLDGNLTLSRNRVGDFTEFLDAYDAGFGWLGQVPVEHEGTDLSFSPAVIAGGGWTWDVLPNTQQHGLTLSWLTKYVSQQYIDNTSDGNNVIDAYTFTDLRLRYELSVRPFQQVALTFLVQNAFDALYETNAWSYRYQLEGATVVDQGFFPQAGRNFLVGLTVGF